MLLEGIGVDKRALNALAEKHIYTVHDLAALMPNKYYDFREVKKVQEVADRLFALTRTQDGFEIAEMDLKARGAGDLMGTEQAGFNKYMRLALDEPALQEKARDAAAYCVANGLGRKLIEVYREHEEQESIH